MKTIEQIKIEIVGGGSIKPIEKILTEWATDILQVAADSAKAVDSRTYYIDSHIKVDKESITNVIKKL